MGKRRETEHTLSAHNSSHLLYCYFLISKLQWNKITVHDNYKELFLHQSNSKINAKEPWYGGTLFLKKKGQRTFNNENVHRIKMLGLTLYPLYSPWLLDIFHQRGKVIDSSPASKSSAPSETKCLTSPSLSGPQNFVGPRDPKRIGRA